MSALDAGLAAHLAGGPTTTCRCWALTRRDGVTLGFTDHDRALTFDGISFRPDTGLSALALQQGTGMSVDNTDAIGALSDAAIREADIAAGRYDGAALRAWLVNWRDVAARQLQFRGSLGDIRRAGGAFHAELRGLTEALNAPRGRVYQTACSAVLGDSDCRFDPDTPGFFTERAAEAVEPGGGFRFAALPGFVEGWFRHGVLRVLGGAAAGLEAPIKRDRIMPGGGREIGLWQPLGAPVLPGDLLRIVAGCDKRLGTCRFKFDNITNFQGFPDIPGDDWTITDPARAARLDGGSRRR